MLHHTTGASVFCSFLRACKYNAQWFYIYMFTNGVHIFTDRTVLYIITRGVTNNYRDLFIETTYHDIFTYIPQRVTWRQIENNS